MPFLFSSENEKPPAKPQPMDPSKLLDHMRISKCKCRVRDRAVSGETLAPRELPRSFATTALNVVHGG